MPVFVILLALICLPFVAIYKHFNRVQAKEAATLRALHLVGSKIPNRFESLRVCEDVLSHFHRTGAESMFVLFLDRYSECIHVEVRFGDSSSVRFPTNEITQIAIHHGARKLVLAHNHPNENATPSDTDISHAAALVASLPNGIEVVDDLVWCRRAVKSVFDTKRYKAMIRRY